MNTDNPRDYIGYGRNNVPDANWPNKAKNERQQFKKWKHWATYGTNASSGCIWPN